MSAAAHTEAMGRWWEQAGITCVDLALRRPEGAMLWQRDCLLSLLPLGWARAHNVQGAEVYIRPARGYAWPLVLLDDVAPNLARRIVRKYAALVVQTSPAGGCHVWLQVTTALEEAQRCQAQRWLAPRVGADPGSVSGEHLGRLAGMKNWKRQGVWVNVLASSTVPQRPAWDPAPALQATPVHTPAPAPSSGGISVEGVDASESGREWGWVCGALEAGVCPETVYRALVDHATPRRGRDAERYARHTVERALHHIR